MNKFDAVVYEQDGRYAVILFGPSEKPKRISKLDIASIEMKSAKQCVARGCMFYSVKNLDMCMKHSLLAHGMVIDSMVMNEVDE